MVVIESECLLYITNSSQNFLAKTRGYGLFFIYSPLNRVSFSFIKFHLQCYGSYLPIKLYASLWWYIHRAILSICFQYILLVSYIIFSDMSSIPTTCLQLVDRIIKLCSVINTSISILHLYVCTKRVMKGSKIGWELPI